tara:strand:+ start:40 stop:501 length:462 start_codon:yes stop_codon:yes gene_type:complete
MNLRQITPKDQLILKEIYLHSINSIDENIYSRDQKFAWASQAWENPKFKNSILNGQGWLLINNNINIGFAIRYPENRLSLFYVRGNYSRKGFGTIILNSVEKDALNSGIKTLETEASLISYKLFLKRNWEIIRIEKVIIRDLIFKRFKMLKII